MNFNTNQCISSHVPFRAKLQRYPTLDHNIHVKNIFSFTFRGDLKWGVSFYRSKKEKSNTRTDIFPNLLLNGSGSVLKKKDLLFPKVDVEVGYSKCFHSSWPRGRLHVKKRTPHSPRLWLLENKAMNRKKQSEYSFFVGQLFNKKYRKDSTFHSESNEHVGPTHYKLNNYSVFGQ